MAVRQVPVTAAVPTARVAVACLVGTTIEFYDFFIYGTAAALVLNAVFFPGLDHAAGTLAAFSTYAVAFLSRPLGAALFGHWGDRLGRKATLSLSLLVMGTATAAVGLLPGYAALGIAAPITLTVLRFLQGLGLGGEWGGAALLAAEYAPAGARGRYAVFPQLGAPLGFLLANGVFLLIRLTMSAEAFADRGWRIPFLAGSPLIVVGLYVRLRLGETPAFRELPATARLPVLDVLRDQWREVLLGAGVITGGYTYFYTATTYTLAYGTGPLGIPAATMLSLTLFAVPAMAAFTLWSGPASDRYGRIPLLRLGCLLGMVWGPVMFGLMNGGQVALVGLALWVTLAIEGILYGPVGAFLPELFPARHRYSGAALTYSLGGVAGGALPPLIATKLQTGPLHSFGVGLYLAAVSALSLACLLTLRVRLRARPGPA